MRIPSRTLVLAGTALIAVAGLAFAACGDDDSTANTPAASPTTATSQPTTAPTTAPTSAPTSVPTSAVAATLKTGSGGALGTVLTDATGFTLYTFKSDAASPGKSVCNGSCASTWPPVAANGTPVAAAGSTGDVSVITRDDGTKQVAYKGQPLYRFAPDKAPGDTTGQGVGNVWFVATP